MPSSPTSNPKSVDCRIRFKAWPDNEQVFQRQFRPELLALREKAVAARQMLAARRLFGKIDKSFLISGWIPERLFAVLEQELNRVTAGQVVIEKVDPEDLREVREGIVKIPILFNNPMLISPFEKLTSLYGTPRYKEVEPTVFFALSFLLLFGMMFGDVGQGGVLFCYRLRHLPPFLPVYGLWNHPDGVRGELGAVRFPLRDRVWP